MQGVQITAQVKQIRFFTKTKQNVHNHDMCARQTLEESCSCVRHSLLIIVPLSFYHVPQLLVCDVIVLVNDTLVDLCPPVLVYPERGSGRLARIRKIHEVHLTDSKSNAAQIGKCESLHIENFANIAASHLIHRLHFVHENTKHWHSTAMADTARTSLCQNPCLDNHVRTVKALHKAASVAQTRTSCNLFVVNRISGCHAVDNVSHVGSGRIFILRFVQTRQCRCSGRCFYSTCKYQCENQRCCSHKAHRRLMNGERIECVFNVSWSSFSDMRSQFI